MSKHYRLQQTLQGASGSPLDRYVNDFSFLGPDVPTLGQLQTLADRCALFITGTWAPSTSPIMADFSKAVAAGGHQQAIYRYEDAIPRAPLFSRVWSLGFTPNEDGFPEEVALCMSFHAAYVAGTDVGPGPHLNARRRGRVYLGPWGTANTVQAGVHNRPATNLLNKIHDAGAALLANNTADWMWQVYSTVDATGRAVVGGWVDDAWDTQRRRGAEPTARVVFS